jgi:hypothetical protein
VVGRARLKAKYLGAKFKISGLQGSWILGFELVARCIDEVQTTWHWKSCTGLIFFSLHLQPSKPHYSHQYPDTATSSRPEPSLSFYLPLPNSCLGLRWSNPALSVRSLLSCGLVTRGFSVGAHGCCGGAAKYSTETENSRDVVQSF